MQKKAIRVKCWDVSPVWHFTRIAFFRWGAETARQTHLNQQPPEIALNEGVQYPNISNLAIKEPSTAATTQNAISDINKSPLGSEFFTRQTLHADVNTYIGINERLLYQRTLSTATTQKCDWRHT